MPEVCNVGDEVLIQVIAMTFGGQDHNLKVTLTFEKSRHLDFIERQPKEVIINYDGKSTTFHKSAFYL